MAKKQSVTDNAISTVLVRLKTDSQELVIRADCIAAVGYDTDSGTTVVLTTGGGEYIFSDDFTGSIASEAIDSMDEI